MEAKFTTVLLLLLLSECVAADENDYDVMLMVFYHWLLA